MCSFWKDILSGVSNRSGIHLKWTPLGFRFRTQTGEPNFDPERYGPGGAIISNVRCHAFLPYYVPRCSHSVCCSWKVLDGVWFWFWFCAVLVLDWAGLGGESTSR